MSTGSDLTKRGRIEQQCCSGPRHDYYRFINETWLNDTEIPDDAASTNISRQIAERIEKQLMGIVRNELINEPTSKLSKFVKSIYHTWNSPVKRNMLLLN